VDSANVGGGEPVVLIIQRGEFFQPTQLLARLNPIHLAFLLDAQQVFKNPAAGTRLRLGFLKSRGIIPITMLHEAPLSPSRRVTNAKDLAQ
jgi:hypothetical protein